MQASFRGPQIVVDLEHIENYVPQMFRGTPMIRAFNAEASALASVTLVAAMLAIWVQLIATLSL